MSVAVMPSQIAYKKQTQGYEAVALRTLNTFAVDVMSIPNSDDLFWYVAKNVVGRLNFVDCVIYKSNLEQTILTQVAAMGEKNPFGRSIVNPLKIPFGEGITGRVAQTREPIIVEDLLDNQSYIPDEKPARSELCVPMVFRNRVVGVIDSEHPDPAAFGTSELEILTTVAAMTSAKLELLEEAERSEHRYRDLVEAHAQLAKETQNRKALEARLFDARKLEAIGRLSGGFAHDFNNILTVISGNLDILSETMNVNGSDVDECLVAAQTAACKGTEMIRSMLAFSQQSRLNPELIDLGEVVSATYRWSNKILPPDIDVKLQHTPETWSVHADKATTENTIINLMLNARDAMPAGGSIEIITENIQLSWPDTQDYAIPLEPGPYVRLSIRDTGIGISEDNQQRIFDPFYTTKAVGSGSGLGLSTVFGFMQQSGGAVNVESKLGEGSTFHLYFPALPSASLTHF